MATLKQKIDAERKLRVLLKDEGLPAPDEVQYGFTCIRFLWHEPKTCVVVDIDELGDESVAVNRTADAAGGHLET
jgi:hypothetical protein